jgi:hypothetical protein
MFCCSQRRLITTLSVSNPSFHNRGMPTTPTVLVAYEEKTCRIVVVQHQMLAQTLPNRESLPVVCRAGQTRHRYKHLGHGPTTKEINQ